MLTAASIPLAFLGNLGVPELLLILVIVLLLFGSTKLPALSRSLGRSIREFKEEMRSGDEKSNPKSPDSDHKDGNGDSKA